MSSSSPGPLALGSEGPRSRPDVPGVSGLGPSAHVFDKLSRVNCTQVRWPAVSSSSPGQLGPDPVGPRGRAAVLGTSDCARGPTVSNCFPGRLAPGSEGPLGRAAVPEHSHLFARARRANLLSRVNGAPVRRPTGSTSSPRRLALKSERLQGRQAVPRDLGPCLRASGVHQLSGQLGPGSEGTEYRPAAPGYSRFGPSARQVDQQFQATRARV